MVILQGLLNYVKQWDKELQDDLVWSDSRRLIVKYGAFLKYDEQNVKQLLKLTMRLSDDTGRTDRERDSIVQNLKRVMPVWTPRV